MTSDLASISVLYAGQTSQPIARELATSLEQLSLESRPGPGALSSLVKPRVIGIAGMDKQALAQVFYGSDLIVCLFSTGITVRLFKDLMTDKIYDPAILSVDHQLKFVIPVIGGHGAGANKAAEGLAAKIGAVAAITTASDSAGRPSLDTFALENGLKIRPRKNYIAVASALNAGKRVLIRSDRPTFTLLKNIFPKVTDHGKNAAGTKLEVEISPAMISVGIGFRAGESAEKLARAVTTAMLRSGIDRSKIQHFCTVSLKKGDTALQALASSYSVPINYFSSEKIAAIYCDNRFRYRLSASNVPQRRIGIPGVAEAAAVLGSGMGKLIFPRANINGVVVAMAKERVL